MLNYIIPHITYGTLSLAHYLRIEYHVGVIRLEIMYA